MSNSTPQLKQYIREQLTNMYLELQEDRRVVNDRRGVKPTDTAPAAAAAAAKTKEAKPKSKQSKSSPTTKPTNIKPRGGPSAKTSPLKISSFGPKIDAMALGTAGTKGKRATKGALGSGGKLGMGAKLGGSVLAAGIQGVDSFTSEWEENKAKGADTGENIVKSSIRGGAGAVGAGGGAYAGMVAGAAIGSVVPVVGTVIGGAIGALAGGYLGGKVGDSLGDKITNMDEDPTKIKDYQADQDIKDIERNAKLQKAKQDAADAAFKPKNRRSDDDDNTDTSDRSQDVIYNDSSPDGKQRQQGSIRYRGSSSGGGPTVDIDMSQYQNQDRRAN